MKKIVFLSFLLVFEVGRAERPSYQVPKICGAFVHIWDPNESDARRKTTDAWYANDHCFIQAEDGSWHAYGIIGHKPIDPWITETNFFHISAQSITQPKWEDHGYALTVKPGVERVLWAPHIIKEADTYYMFYNVGNLQPDAKNQASWGQLCVATSGDLFHWTRHDRNPLFSDPGHARDSYVLKYNGQFYYYYTRVFNEVDHRSSVAVRIGQDPFHWSGPKIAHVQPLKNNYAGDAESAFVIRKDDLFYMFLCRANTEYNRTDVYWSKDPENFPEENLVCTLPVHAAEVVHDKMAGWFISNTGWDKKGLSLAPLEWQRSP